MNINDEIYKMKIKIENRLNIINDNNKNNEYNNICLIEEKIKEVEKNNNSMILESALALKA